MTQKAKLIQMLNEQEWVCSTDFQANYIPEFRSLISHLNKYEGFVIIDELCLGQCGKNHTSKGLKRWKMLTKPAYFGKTEHPCSPNRPCFSYKTFKVCSCPRKWEQEKTPQLALII